MKARIFVYPRRNVRYVIRASKTINESDALIVLRKYLAKYPEPAAGVTEVAVTFEEWKDEPVNQPPAAENV
jgi:hypothetical protein